MFNRKYDSYGYDEPQAFVTTADQKKLKYPPVKYVPEEFTQIESFVSQDGTNLVDLVQPEIGCSE